MRKAIGNLLGYRWTAKLGGKGVAGVFVGAFLLAATCAAFGARVWPIRNDPAFDPPTSPSVRREGERLIIDPPVEYYGTPAGGGRNVAYRSYLKIVPAGPPRVEGANCLGISPEGVLLNAHEKDILPFSASAYERAQHLAAALLFAAVALLPLPFFLLSARMLLGFRFRSPPRPSALRVTARAFVPAFVFAGAAALVFPINAPPMVAFAVLYGVGGAAILYGVAEGASAAVRPSTPGST